MRQPGRAFRRGLARRILVSFACCSALGACGRSCVPSGAPCAITYDCRYDEFCGVDGTCRDQCHSGLQEEDETDVDCGGGYCEPCATGRRCSALDDCLNGWCEANSCGERPDHNGSAPVPLPGYDPSLGVRLADLDGDGHVELTWQSHDGAYVRRGQPAGFGPAQRCSAHSDIFGGARASALGDVDEDGRIDLVEVHQWLPWYGVMIMRGVRDGFSCPGLDREARAHAVGDVDGDGLADIAVLQLEGRAELWRGHGDGTFAHPLGTGPVLSFQPDADVLLRSAALDVAGGEELVAAAGSSFAILAFANGSLVRRQEVQSGAPITDLVVREVDGRDGRDVIVAAGGELLLFSNEAGGLAMTPNKLTGPGDVSRLAIGDVDADGIPDIVVAGSSRAYHVLRGVGPGRFAPPSRIGEGKSRPTVLSLADLDGDGRDDLVATDETTPGVRIQRSNGASFMSAFEAPTGQVPRELASADFDGDRRSDVLVVGGDGALELLQGDGAGGFAPSRKLRDDGRLSVGGLSIGDLDRDGRLDAVRTIFGTLQIDLAPGSDAPLRPLIGVRRVTGQVRSLSLVDTDGDAHLDLVAAIALDNGAAELRVMPGDGRGGFADGHVEPHELHRLGRIDFYGPGNWVPHLWSTDSAGRSCVLVPGDLDGDGRVEPPVLSERRVILPATDFLIGGFPCAVTLGDLDGDAGADVLMGLEPTDPEEDQGWFVPRPSPARAPGTLAVGLNRRSGVSWTRLRHTDELPVAATELRIVPSSGSPPAVLAVIAEKGQEPRAVVLRPPLPEAP